MIFMWSLLMMHLHSFEIPIIYRALGFLKTHRKGESRFSFKNKFVVNIVGLSLKGLG